MNAWVLHAPNDDSGTLRWGASAAIIVALHAGLIALGIAWYTHAPPAGSPMATILIDLPPAPSSAAPEPQQMDVAPGPPMQQGDAPSPPPEPPKQETVQEQIPSTPPQEKPVVAAPPEQKVEPKPEPPKPAPVKPKHVETKKPSDRPPAPRTTAAPKAERQAPAASARAGAAASAAALPAYREKLAAHLQRFKQYPAGAKASGEQGTAMLSFTVSRSGQVLASRLAGSSGHPALDAETLAMIRRAQPLPAFPPEMKQASLSFTVPVHFSLR
ncbi:MAG: TonB family protein [Proteobacteria bacterium]|nr:TonB family protein [Pseudomonadota bacterium]